MKVDETHYKNWTGLISELGSRGIKVLTYINPLVSNVSQRGTPYRHNYYQEALEEGFAVRNGDGTVWTGYSDSLLIDLSNPLAYQWMKNMIVNVRSPLFQLKIRLSFLFWPITLDLSDLLIMS